MPDIYSFTVKDINGKDFSFASLKGKKIMIVNTASECGLTPQYENLQRLYNQYKDSNFVIVGFPANNFGAQEPGNNEQIAGFCSSKFNVTFPMMEKISVKDTAIAPIYQWLTEKEKNGVEDCEMIWNFQKFLIDEEGHFVRNVHPKVLPDDPSVISWIRSKK
jgi:glutathione peroxidase